MPRGKGQSKDYLFINLRAHYLNVSISPRRQTIQAPGVDATSAKRPKGILVQLPLPVRRQGRKKSSLFSMITYSRMSRYDLTFLASIVVH